MTIAGLVMAGGSGARFGGLKQFAELVDGARLIDRAVATVATVADWIAIVLPPGQVWDGAEVDVIGIGGASRQASVAAGLALLPASIEVVVVHSASHPLASSALARASAARVIAGADAAVPVLPLVDVVKRFDDDGLLSTVGRQGLGLAQSPMAFSRPVLDRAFGSGATAIEESELVEKVGGRVHMIPGEVTNIHVVDQAGLALVRTIAASLPVV